jgi:hypothetical protein
MTNCQLFFFTVNLDLSWDVWGVEVLGLYVIKF